MYFELTLADGKLAGSCPQVAKNYFEIFPGTILLYKKKIFPLTTLQVTSNAGQGWAKSRESFVQPLRSKPRCRLVHLHPHHGRPHLPAPRRHHLHQLLHLLQGDLHLNQLSVDQSLLCSCCGEIPRVPGAPAVDFKEELALCTPIDTALDPCQGDFIPIDDVTNCSSKLNRERARLDRILKMKTVRMTALMAFCFTICQVCSKT